MTGVSKEVVVDGQYAVWWTNEFDCNMVFSVAGAEDAPTMAPEYVRKEFRFRNGRAGRGRLFIPEGLPKVEIDWDESRAICHRLAEYPHSYGGIVMHMSDVPAIIHLPGLFTDLRLNVIQLPDIIGFIF